MKRFGMGVAALALALGAGTARAQYLQVPTGFMPGYGWSSPGWRAPAREVLIWHRPRPATNTAINGNAATTTTTGNADQTQGQAYGTDNTGFGSGTPFGTSDQPNAGATTTDTTGANAANGANPSTGYDNSGYNSGYNNGYGGYGGYTYIQPGARNQSFDFSMPGANVGIRPLGGIIQAPQNYGYNGYGGYGASGYGNGSYGWSMPNNGGYGYGPPTYYYNGPGY